VTYSSNPNAPGYWHYDGLPVQADVETHQITLSLARKLAVQGCRLLDVAAGHGALSKALLDAGFDVSCTSWNENVGLAIPRYRIDLDKSFTTADVGGQLYQAVCALEIIEHVENPAQMLRSIAGILPEGGMLFLSTPNVESAQARLEWLIRGCPYSFSGQEISENRHISILWKQGLEHFIHMAGFDIVEMHLAGIFRHHSRSQALLRTPVYWLMKQILPGDLDGASRLYALRRSGRSARVLGSDEVA